MNRRTNSLSRRYLHALLEILSHEEAHQVHDAFCEKLSALENSRSVYDNNVLNRHLTQNILPGIALYDAFQSTGCSQEEAIALFDRFNQILYRGTAALYRALGRLPGFFPLLRVLCKRSMSVTYPAAGWTTTWLENSSKRITFHVSRCFYHDILTQYDRAFLTRSFCRVDDEVYGNMSSKAVWARTKTIGRGDLICDFCFLSAGGRNDA
jgi:hypothetical protein